MHNLQKLTWLSLPIHEGKRPLISFASAPPATPFPESPLWSPLSLDHFASPANRPSAFFSDPHLVSCSRTLQDDRNNQQTHGR